MLFVYIAAITMAIGVWIGCLAMLTLPGAWVLEHTLGLLVLMCIMGGVTWAIIGMTRAAYDELGYWDFF